jgi:peptidoglycan/LPS O-acetylase OafA/YrhL
VGQDLFWFFAIDPESGQLVYAPFRVDPRHDGRELLLNAPAFTVALELLFYLLAPLFLRSRRRLALVFCAAVAYHAALRPIGQLNLEYHFFPATLLFFCLGAGIYWLSSAGWQLHGRAYALLAVAVCAVLSLPLLFPSFVILLFACALPWVFALTRSLRTDRVVGDLSYPVYLAHWPILTLRRPHFEPASLGAATLAATLAVAALLYAGVERFRQRWAGGRLRVDRDGPHPEPELTEGEAGPVTSPAG